MEARRLESDTGISPIVGLILMIAVTVVLSFIVGHLIFGFSSVLDANSTTETGVNIENTQNGVEVTASTLDADSTVLIKDEDGNTLSTISSVGETKTITSVDDGETITVLEQSDGSNTVIQTHTYTQNG
jgi:flagellin-like protein